jgi:hypothetical protein
MHMRYGIPVTRRLLVVTILLLAACLTGARPSHGAPATAPPATFAVTITPGNGVGQGDLVYISGYAAVDSTKLMVKIAVTFPKGVSSITVFAPMRKDDGYFIACFNQTGVAGNYSVRATSPGGGAIGTATFKVNTGFGPPDDAPVLGKLGVQFERHIEGLLQGLPASPAEADLQTKLDDLRPKLAEGLKQIQKYDAAVKDLMTTFKDFPTDRPQYAGLLKKLDDWNAKAKDMENTLRQEMRDDQSGSVRCDDVAHLEKELADLNALIGDIEGPMHAVADFERAYKRATGAQLEASIGCVIGQIVVKKTTIDPAFRDALSKLDPAEVPVAFFDAVLTLAGDAVTAGSQKLFAVYCEKFEGPFTANLHATFYSGGKPWWTYDLGLKGTLTLRYAKGGGTGDTLKLTGSFEGDATNFAMSEDALRVMFPKLVRGALLFHKAILPTAPIHFNIPVEGEIGRDTATVSLASGGTDIPSDTNAHVTYVVVTPLTLAPQVVKFDLPYANARLVLGRAMANKPAQFKLAVDQANKVTTIARDFSFTKGQPGSTAYGQFTLSVKACNPACP